MIVIPPMPTRLRALPELRIPLERGELLHLARALGRVKVEPGWREGLCAAVESVSEASCITVEFSRAIHLGMNRGNFEQEHQYVYSYLEGWCGRGLYSMTVEELAEIRQAWAKHIEVSIYEQAKDWPCVTP